MGMDPRFYVRGKWVPFDSATINKAYGLKDDDSDAYKALFRNPNYDMFLKILTNCREPWKRNPKTGKVTIFPKVVLKQVPKAWFFFLYSHLISSLLVYTVQRDKAILHHIKFDLGFMIENSILEVL